MNNLNINTSIIIGTSLLGVIMGWILSHMSMVWQSKYTYRKSIVLEDKRIKQNLQIQAYNEIATASQKLNISLIEFGVCNFIDKSMVDIINNLQDDLAFWQDRKKDANNKWFEIVMLKYNFQFVFEHRRIILKSLEPAFKNLEIISVEVEKKNSEIIKKITHIMNVINTEIINDEIRDLATMGNQLIVLANKFIIIVDEICRDVQNLALGNLYDYQLTEKSTGITEQIQALGVDIQEDSPVSSYRSGKS